MKYMGSKRAMLCNGLGLLLTKEIPRHRRFIDLFTGSATVATYAARNFAVETHAYDLQLYARIVAGAILERTRQFDGEKCWEKWRARAERRLPKELPEPALKMSAVAVDRARAWSAQAEGSLVAAYGGHYYSPRQACWIQALRETLPSPKEERSACLAALIIACSKCAASPGHTAQPFQPTPTALPFLESCWRRDLLQDVKAALVALSGEFAKVHGKAAVGEANATADKLKPKDLVFVDPPYSAVQYSRFYHVLEAVAIGEAGEVFGAGRYPSRESRPTSSYSFKSSSHEALKDLLQRLANNETTVILTFPDHLCSNGISGDAVREVAQQYFRVFESSITSKFSTLGGPAGVTEKRAARRHANELMLLLRPR